MVNTMKPQNVMFELAKARAIEKGPVIIDRNTNDTATKLNEYGSYVVGYALTKAELIRVYTDNGYNLERKTWEKHIQAWEFSQKIEHMGNYLFFKDTGRKAELSMINSLNRGEVVQVIG